MTTITRIDALPGCPYNGTGTVGIIITSGVPSYFKLTGSELGDITSVTWYPMHPSSVKFEMRGLILVDDTTGTFMVRVTDNYLYNTDRGGHISFRLSDGTTLTSPVKTYGRVSASALWTSPYQGLITG
jgi:hypothetical protein